MADKLYIDEGVTVYFEWWDDRLSASKPKTDDDPAWIQEEQVGEVTMTVFYPNGDQETQSYTGNDIEMTGPGKFRTRFITHATVSGDHYAVWRGVDITGFPQVSVSKITSKELDE